MSRPVERIDDELRASVRAMFDLMYAARGIGLAANQVALPFRFFVLNLTADPEQRDQERVFINPVIVKKHSTVEEEEGCLSFPGLYAKVRRARKIRVKGFDLDGNEIDVEAEDLLSRAIQHETDHLSGTLFIDHLGLLARHPAAAKLKEFEAQFRQARAAGEFPDDAELTRRLETLAVPSIRQAQPESPDMPPPPPKPAAPEAEANEAADADADEPGPVI